ncbi:unnamed protein product [Rotaria magnacalcarata]
MNSLVPITTSSSKSASTKSSTCASHTAIQYQSIFSVKSSDVAKFSNLSIHSSIVSPLIDIPAAISHYMNTTFIKQITDEQIILSPSTASLLSPETFICQTSPKSSSSPILPKNNSSSLHNLTPLLQLTHSADGDLSMNEDHTELECFFSMSDTQYEAYLQVDQRRRQIISTIKKRVANEHIPVCSIVEQEYATAKLTKEEQEIFKTPKQLESGLLKSRRKMYPPLPTCQNFVIPDFISKTIDSTPFLLFDQTRNEFGGRLLVFSSQSQMDLLLDAEVLMADGTFRSCPRLFEQIYVILAVKDSKTYPVLFALTSNRKEATYITILDVIRTEAQHRGVSFAPHVFISDYEQAWMNAVKRKLITTPISGCWFHHVQAIYRWIQSNGLSKTYQEHEEKRQILGSFMALSLLPKDRVLEGLHIVKSRAVKHNELRQFCVGATAFRTNNPTESNNHRLNARIRQWHPNIWYFLVHLRTEEATISRNILKANLALIAPSQYQPTSKKHAAKKTMQIIHLHQLLEKKSRPLEDVITSLSYLVGSGKIKAFNAKH